MDRPIDLPDFREPPVDEVVAGVFHDRAGTFSEELVVDLFQGLRKTEYTQFETQSRLTNSDPDPLSEPSLVTAPQVQISSQHESPRFWLTSADDQRLVQIQDNLLFVNWRRGGADAYPHFEDIVNEFERVAGLWAEKLGTAGLPLSPSSVVEVTYLNWVPDDSMTMAEFFRPAGALVMPAQGVGPPESTGWRSAHPVVSDDLRVGRLTVECRSAARTSPTGDVQSGSKLALSARLLLVEGSLRPTMLIGRRSIVETFASITLEGAHDKWDRCN